MVTRIGFYIESNTVEVDISPGAVRLGRSRPGLRDQACGGGVATSPPVLGILSARPGPAPRGVGFLPRRRDPPRGGKISGGQRILRIFVRHGAVCGWFGLPTGI